MADRSQECWRALFSLTDDFREQANASNLDSRTVFNVTVGQMRVLKAVAWLSLDGNRGIMLKTLAEKVKLTSGAVSIIVDSLVRQGLLERRHSEVDRRAVNIFLSAEGQKKIGSYIAFFDRRTAEFLAELTPAEVTAFLSLLERFRTKVNS